MCKPINKCMSQEIFIIKEVLLIQSNSMCSTEKSKYLLYAFTQHYIIGKDMYYDWLFFRREG